jgi:hypothetical protein
LWWAFSGAVIAAQAPAQVVGVGGYAHIVADLDRAMKFLRRRHGIGNGSAGSSV